MLVPEPPKAAKAQNSKCRNFFWAKKTVADAASNLDARQAAYIDKADNTDSKKAFHNTEDDAEAVTLPKLTRFLEPLEELRQEGSVTEQAKKAAANGKAFNLSCSFSKGCLVIQDATTLKVLSELSVFWTWASIVEEVQLDSRDVLVVRGQKGVGWFFACSKAKSKALLAAITAQGAVRTDIDQVLKLDVKLGSGSYGTVFRGTYKSGESQSETLDVAVKLIPASPKVSTVLQEVELLVAAQGHPNIIGFKGSFCTFREAETPGAPNKVDWHLVTDLHERDLYEHTLSNQGLELSPALRIFHDLLSALNHLHELGIFHRDVKPENILIAKGDRAVLTDFGISGFVNNAKHVKQRGVSIGYTSPEVLEGKGASCLSDVFSAGVAFYFTITQQTPFMDPNMARMATLTKQCKFHFDRHHALQVLTEEHRSLILQMICCDEDRISAKQALDHPVMQRVREEAFTPLPEVSAMTALGSQFHSAELEDFSDTPSQKDPMAEKVIMPMQPTPPQSAPSGGRSSLLTRFSRGVTHLIKGHSQS